MLPALRLQLKRGSFSEDRHLRPVLSRPHDAANPGDRDACNGPRDPGRCSRSKEQLIIFAPVQNRRNLRGFVQAGSQRMRGKQRRIDLSGNPRCRTKMGKIGRKPIRKVDAGRRKAAAQKRLADRDARLREQVRVVAGVNSMAQFVRICYKRGKFGGGASERPSHVEKISRVRPRTTKRVASGSSAQQGDVGEDVVARRLRGVAARQWDLERFSEAQEAIQKAVQPGSVAGDGLWQGEREETCQRGCTHGSEVGKPTSECSMPYGLRRVDVAQKMAAFEGKVRGDQKLLAEGRGEDGAVVPDAQAEGFGPLRRGAGADAFDQGELAGRGAGFWFTVHGVQDSASW